MIRQYADVTKIDIFYVIQNNVTVDLTYFQYIQTRKQIITHEHLTCTNVFHMQKYDMLTLYNSKKEYQFLIVCITNYETNDDV